MPWSGVGESCSIARASRNSSSSFSSIVPGPRQPRNCATNRRCSVRVCAGGRTNPNHGSVQDELAERGKSGEDRQALLDELLAIINDHAIPDEQVGGLVRGERIGSERLRAAAAQAKPRRSVSAVCGMSGRLMLIELLEVIGHRGPHTRDDPLRRHDDSSIY